MKFSPLILVPQSVIDYLRANASRNAFFADMLRVIQRDGGVTQKQLDLILTSKQMMATADHLLGLI